MTLIYSARMPKKEALAEARREFARKLRAAKEEGDAAMEKVGLVGFMIKLCVDWG